MGPVATLYALIGFAILGGLALAIPRPPALVPVWIEKAWRISGFGSGICGVLFFLALWGPAFFVQPTPLFDMVSAALVGAFPNAPSAEIAAVLITGPIIAPVALWVASGLGVLPFHLRRLASHQRPAL
jgi:hypothetical protein